MSNSSWVMEKFNFFKNFKKIRWWGATTKKLKNFGKSKKIIIDLYELDNSKKKNFFLKKKFSK